ncbi:MAG: Gfo/Idh/MocA family oxidoreductase [Planctomycetes bacterium]|nr:Gfo/Idh/MocA family oxidoreductase [Planctomycetota bacterium]MBI3834660.1 Gfo/Idh/MocA family oxidoreductase [Planctomycetota bacterium]
MAENRNNLNLGVIGLGHWGPNHVRVFGELDRATVTWCADTNSKRLTQIKSRFPHLQTSKDYSDLLADPDVNAVVIATPTHTHFKIAMEAIHAGKHVLVEKPMCMTTEEARTLTQAAESAGVVLMVGHVFVFNAGIVRLREFIESGEIGEIHYLDAVRTNLGPVRGDVNALYDLGTHDISIFNYLLNSRPVSVSAIGSRISQPTIEDVVFATLQYPGDVLAHIHVSWLNPKKVRTLTAVGDRKMAHWDDVDPQDTLRLYDKGLAEPPTYNSFGEFQCLLRSADVHIPKLHAAEPLRTQAEAFRNWVLDGKPCPAGPREGAEVVAVLETAMHSMHNGGAMLPIVYDDVRAGPIVSAEAKEIAAVSTGARSKTITEANKPTVAKIS